LDTSFLNKLPAVLPQISDPSNELAQASPLAISPKLFHSKLKTLLFSQSYPDWSSSTHLPSLSTQNTILTLWILTHCLSILFWLSTWEYASSRDSAFVGAANLEFTITTYTQSASE